MQILSNHNNKSTYLHMSTAQNTTRDIPERSAFIHSEDSRKRLEPNSTAGVFM